MRTKYDRELTEISDKLVLMCRHIESAIKKSVIALVEQDLDIIHEILEEDRIVGKLQRKIEKQSLKLLARQQPVATDLRNIFTALKMVTDLERISDQATDIAELTVQLGEAKRPEYIPQMATIVIQLVKDGIKAYINRDNHLAKSLEKTDDKVDDLFNMIIEELLQRIQQDPTNASEIVKLIQITKYLEKIGDHAVNLGKWVEYSITGKTPKRQKRKSSITLPDEPDEPDEDLELMP